MPITQVLLTQNTGGGGGGGNPPVGQYNYGGSLFTYAFSSGNGDPVLQNLQLPGGEYEDLLTFSSTGWQMTGTHGILGSFFIDFWFYPFATDCILLTEHGDAGYGAENQGYHYSVLEITGDAKVKARTWPMSGANAVVSTGTVTVGGWNHINLYYYSGTLSLTLNGESAVQTTSTRDAPGSNQVYGFGTTSVTNMGSSNRFQGRISKFRFQGSLFFTTYDDTRARYGR